MEKINKSFLILITIIFLGIFYRLYHANFEDYWFDEYFGFWISDSQLNFTETLERSFGLGQGQNLLFDFVLKYFYVLFEYYPENGRYFTVFISSLSIPLLTYLSYQVDKSKSYLLTAFLTSHCWYLISYSQEVRGYTLGLLLAILSFIIFLILIKSNNQNLRKNIYIYFLYILVNLIGLINHVFFGLVVLSHFIFSFNFIGEKKKFKILIANFVLVGAIYLFIMFPFLIKNLNTNDFWITQVNFEFFISYFFPRFFGSKIMGYIYLLTLIFLIIKGKKFIFESKSIHQLFFILLFSSYFFPLFYSLFKIPILIDRYIIFVLIPIILLISILTFKQSTKIRNFIIILIVLTTFVNNYLEIFKRVHSKPEFNKSLSFISSNKDTAIKLLANKENDHMWLVNYLKKISFSKYEKLNFLNFNQLSDSEKLWVLCYLPVNSFKCNSEEINQNYIKDSEKSFFLIKVFLYKKK